MKSLPLLALLALSVTLGGCLGFDCERVDTLPEFDDLQGTSEASIKTIVFYPNTLDVDSLYPGKVVVIEDSLTYAALKAANDSICDICIFPDVDFATQSLFGVLQLLDCNAGALIKVVETPLGYHHYTKSVDETKCSYLSCDNYSFGWATVPKLDSTALITSSFGEEYFECRNCN